MCSLRCHLLLLAELDSLRLCFSLYNIYSLLDLVCTFAISCIYCYLNTYFCYCALIYYYSWFICIFNVYCFYATIIAFSSVNLTITISPSFSPLIVSLFPFTVTYWSSLWSAFLYCILSELSTPEPLVIVILAVRYSMLVLILLLLRLSLHLVFLFHL